MPKTLILLCQLDKGMDRLFLPLGSLYLADALEHPPSDPQWRARDRRFGSLTGPRGEGRLHSAQTRELAKGALAAGADILAAVRGARDLPPGAFPLPDPGDPRDEPFDHPRFVRDASRLCWLAAVVHAEDGDLEAALDALDDLGTLAAALNERPVFGEGLVSMTCLGMQFACAERIMETGEIPADAIRRLRQQLAANAGRTSLRWPFIAELATAHFMFTELPAHEAAAYEFGHVSWQLRLLLLVPTLRERDAMTYYGHMQRRIEATEQPPRRRLAVTDEIRAEALALELNGPPTSWYSMVTAPSYDATVRKEVAVQMRARAAQAALAAEQYRLANGRWPDSLDQLVPGLLAEVPEDAFSDGQVIYRRTEHGIAVYSVGPDGGDDGGVPEWEVDHRLDEPADAWDISFRLLDPELRGTGATTFREEALEADLDLDDLHEAGFTNAALDGLGFGPGNFGYYEWPDE